MPCWQSRGMEASQTTTMPYCWQGSIGLSLIKVCGVRTVYVLSSLTLPVWKLECRTSGVLDHLVELPAQRLLFLGRDLVSVPRASATQTQQLSLAPFLLTPTQHFVFEKSFSLHAIRRGQCKRSPLELQALCF